MSDQMTPDVTDDDRKLARKWAEGIEANPKSWSLLTRNAARVVLATAPDMAHMIAGMREEWGVSYRLDHENEGRIAWGWKTREDAERSMRLMTGAYVYGPVRRYVTEPEEIS